MPQTAAEKIRIEDLSITFLCLAEDAEALKFSDDQQKQLRELEDVNRAGIYWISLREAPQKSEAKSRFLKYADQFVLLGILTQQRAMIVRKQIMIPK